MGRGRRRGGGPRPAAADRPRAPDPAHRPAPGSRSTRNGGGILDLIGLAVRSRDPGPGGGVRRARSIRGGAPRSDRASTVVGWTGGGGTGVGGVGLRDTRFYVMRWAPIRLP